nr:hypothetical protein [Haloterrigena salifodinae]
MYDDYVEVLPDRTASLPTGDPTADDTIIGSIIDEGATSRRAATRRPRRRTDVLLNAGNAMDAAANKHFGPIAPITSYSSDTVAFELANETRSTASQARSTVRTERRPVGSRAGSTPA